MKQIIECAANFSEGRDSNVIKQIQDAIASTPETYLLDLHSDEDHNRSVITFVSSPEFIVQATFNGIAKAAELIDLDTHMGTHPRLGAADVVPFIPIKDVTIDDCINAAHELGKKVAEDLNIPVYLYEQAALKPERVNLADVRRGGYELLKSEIATNENRLPDYGPTTLPKAGAVIIGARHPLIAYNVYLTTDNVEIAKKIAEAVRHSSGGMHYLKALGMLVNGKAQVSMNFTDYTKTSIFHVVEFIRREAVRYGVQIESSELVGLIPQQALIDAAQWYLQIDNLTPSSILETRLNQVIQHEKNI